MRTVWIQWEDRGETPPTWSAGVIQADPLWGQGSDVCAHLTGRHGDVVFHISWATLGRTGNKLKEMKRSVERKVEGCWWRKHIIIKRQPACETPKDEENIPCVATRD